MTESGTDNDTMRREAIAGIVRSVTLEVFATMVNLEVLPGQMFTESHASDGAEGVMAFVGLAGRCRGTGSLRCSSETACRLASSLLMAEFASVDGDVLDAIGELANMVIGNLKTCLEDRLGPISLSIPTVIHGRNFTARSSSSDEWTVVPFLWGGGQLDVKICLKAAEEDASRAGARQEFLLAGMRKI